MKSRSLTTNTLCLLASILVVMSIGATDKSSVRAQSEDTVVARVNDTSITLKEVDNSIVSRLLPLQQQIHALRRTALENLIVRAVLEGEAKKRGIAVEELRKQLTTGKIDVLQNQVEELYAENASAFAFMSVDEAKERLRLDLESQARMRNYREALAVLRQNSNTQVFLEEPRLPSFSDGDNAPSIGSNEAAVTIAEFSDFQCRYCKEAQGVIKQVLRSYGSDVRLIFKHLPLDIHAEAFGAAQAAFCAEDQGLFWPYHDALFASETLSAAAFNTMATDLGLSLPKFQACVLSEASRAAVRKDMQEARRLGIASTPTFIVNGKLLRGARGFEEFKALIERELNSARNTSRTNKP